MWWSPGSKTSRYHQVEQHDGADSHLLEDNPGLPLRSRCSFHAGWGVLLFIIGILPLTILCSWLVHSSRLDLDLDRLCTGHISQFSPVVQDVGIRYETKRFNGSLLKPNIYRQDASPAVDAAWEALGVNYRSVRIPAEDAARSNLLPDQVKINEKHGGGYPANVEGLHHLHCLNLLRQALFYNFEYYHARGEGPFRNSDNILHLHITHCLDIIRQQLMCTVDVGVLGQVWWNQTAPESYVDFNTKHTCRNFEQIRGWAEEHQLPAQVPSDFLEPPKRGDTVYESIP